MIQIIRYSYAKQQFIVSYIKFNDSGLEVGQSNGLGQDIVDIIYDYRGKIYHCKNSYDFYLQTKEMSLSKKQLIKEKLIRFISRL